MGDDSFAIRRIRFDRIIDCGERSVRRVCIIRIDTFSIFFRIYKTRQRMVSGKRRNNLGAEIVAGSFQIISGIPTTIGGDDDGPDPHELLEAALASCTIITVQMYANRKQIRLNSTNVVVKIDSESKDATIVSLRIELDGDLSEEERQKLYEIAGKCPIHRLLKSQVTIVTTHP